MMGARGGGDAGGWGMGGGGRLHDGGMWVGHTQQNAASRLLQVASMIRQRAGIAMMINIYQKPTMMKKILLRQLPCCCYALVACPSSCLPFPHFRAATHVMCQPCCPLPIPFIQTTSKRTCKLRKHPSTRTHAPHPQKYPPNAADLHCKCTSR